MSLPPRKPRKYSKTVGSTKKERFKYNQSIAIDKAVEKYHFKVRYEERVTHGRSTVSKDFARAISQRGINKCLIYNVYKLYGQKYRFIMDDKHELITIYKIDKKLESKSNKKHRRERISNDELLNIKLHFELLF